MNLLESHRQLEVFCLPTCLLDAGGPTSTFFKLDPLEIGLPTSFCEELGCFCTPDGAEEANSG